MADERLTVFLHDELAGHLWLDTRRRFSFQYDLKYLDIPGAVPLSISLPFDEKPYLNDTARPFFTNLLPEGDVRSLIARIKGISDRNDFKLLEAIGGECAGAVSLVSEQVSENETPDRAGEYIPLSTDELENIIGENTARPILIIKSELRLSLAGAQNKIPLYYDGSVFYLTRGIAPSSHILKPQNPNFSDLIQNEYFCMKLAAAVKLSVPFSFIWKGKKQIAYIVERYDRIRTEDKSIERLHQEDFCQALNCMPDQKYENEGGPGIMTCCRIIESAFTQPVLDKQALARWVIFNFLIGNADAHAKNISLIRKKNGAICLAPFYDLISTGVYPEIARKMAMKIGTENRFEWVKERHWRQMADQMDIKYAYLKKLMHELINTVELQSPKVAEAIHLQYGGRKTIVHIRRFINERIRQLKTFTH